MELEIEGFGVFFAFDKDLFLSTYWIHHKNLGLDTGIQQAQHTSMIFMKHISKITYILELPEWHKLDNVSDSWFSRRGPKDSIVTIKKLHGTKVCSSNTHNDDGHGQF